MNSNQISNQNSKQNVGFKNSNTTKGITNRNSESIETDKRTNQDITKFQCQQLTDQLNDIDKTEFGETITINKLIQFINGLKNNLIKIINFSYRRLICQLNKLNNPKEELSFLEKLQKRAQAALDSAISVSYYLNIIDLELHNNKKIFNILDEINQQIEKIKSDEKINPESTDLSLEIYKEQIKPLLGSICKINSIISVIIINLSAKFGERTSGKITGIHLYFKWWNADSIHEVLKSQEGKTVSLLKLLTSKDPEITRNYFGTPATHPQIMERIFKTFKQGKSVLPEPLVGGRRTKRRKSKKIQKPRSRTYIKRKRRSLIR